MIFLAMEAMTLLSWWHIHMLHPGSFVVAGVQKNHTHIKEGLQAIQELIDQILSFSTIFAE